MIELNLGSYIVLGIIALVGGSFILYHLYKIIIDDFICATTGINKEGEQVNIFRAWTAWVALCTLFALVYFFFKYGQDDTKFVIMITNSILAGVLSLIPVLLTIFIKYLKKVKNETNTDKH